MHEDSVRKTPTKTPTTELNQTLLLCVAAVWECLRYRDTGKERRPRCLSVCPSDHRFKASIHRHPDGGKH